MVAILLQFSWYMLVAAGAALAVFLMPGWWWMAIAAVAALAAALAIADGMGARRARRLARWLFWTRP